MNTHLIYKNKWFCGWNDEKEEAWLRQMACSGLHLVKLAGLARYAFQTGEPQDVVYRLDYYTGRSGEYKNYLRLFQDDGWELVGDFVGWQYFRKPVENGETPEILTDNESKIRKYQNLLGVLGGCTPITILSLIFLLERAATPFIILLSGFMVVMCGFYAFCFAGLLGRINQLKRI